MTEQKKVGSAAYEAIGESEVVTTQDLAARLGVAHENVRQALMRLERAGKVVKAGPSQWRRGSGKKPASAAKANGGGNGKAHHKKKGKKKRSNGDQLAHEMSNLRAKREKIITEAVQKAGMAPALKRLEKAIRSLGGEA